MGGKDREFPWVPVTGGAGGKTKGGGHGPRWIISVRAVIVVLAIATSVIAVLWINQSGVSAASEQLASQDPAKIAVPPLENGSTAAGTATATTMASGVDGSESEASPVGTQPLNATAVPSLASNSVMVHVVGAVKSPGVITLPAGSRVVAAIDAAGGALPAAQLSGLNLAAVVVDGTQIIVPTQEQVQAGLDKMQAGEAYGTGAGTGNASEPGQPNGSPLNLNTATAEELDALPGVGPVLAERILAWRKDHGPFSSVEELDAVSGIGVKMLATLLPLVTVS